MQITVEQLYAIVGQQQVELQLLRSQNAALLRQKEMLQGAMQAIRAEQSGEGAPPNREAGES